MMDNKEIKEYFKKDQIVSDKANNVFDNFIKEIKTENVKESKVVDLNEHRVKLFNFRKIMTVAASLVVVFVGSNVYARTQGYDNIFFMLKDITTAKSVDDPEEIFVDKDIVISYSSLKVTDNIEMQVNELQVKDNKAKLYLLVKELENNETSPLKYKVYDNNGILLYDAESKKDKDESIYTEVLLLSNYSDDVENLKVEIYSKNNVLLKSLNIDLEGKSIEAKTENVEVKKISQIELKKFLTTETEKCYTKNELKNKKLIVLEVFDIYFDNGTYTVKYLFMIPTEDDFKNGNVENSDVYVNSIDFTVENDKYNSLKMDKPGILY